MIAKDRLRAGDGDGGRPDGQSRPQPTSDVYPERDVILEERRSRVDNEPAAAAGRAADGRAVPAPSLPPAGDRLVPRDRELHPRGRARLLPDLVRAQQRRPGRRRRRRPRPSCGRWPSAPMARIPARPVPAAPPAGRAAAARRARASTLRRPARAPAEPDPLLPGAELHLGRTRARLRARGAGRDPGRRRHQPALPRARGRAGLAAGAGAYYRGSRLDRHHASASMPARARASTWPSSRRRSTPRSTRMLARRRSPRTSSTAHQRRLLAEAIYARDSLAAPRASSARALTTGRTVDDVEAWPARIAAVTPEQVDAAARHVLRPGASVTGQPAARRTGHARPGRWRERLLGPERRGDGRGRPPSARPRRGRGGRDARAASRAYLIARAGAPVPVALALALPRRRRASTRPAGRASPTWRSGLLDEGAGPYDSQAFRRRARGPRDPAAASMPTATALAASCKTLTAHREHAFELLRLALTAAALRRRAGRAGAQPDPGRAAPARGRARLPGLAAPGSSAPSRTIPMAARPAARPRASAAITRDDLTRLRRPPPRPRQARRSASPATSPPTSWRRCSTATFGGLPGRGRAARGRRRPCPRAGGTGSCACRCPQSVVIFGDAGLQRDDPDYYAAYVANYILGGGGFSLAADRGDPREARPRLLGLLLPLRRSTTRRCGSAGSRPRTSRSAESLR